MSLVEIGSLVCAFVAAVLGSWGLFSSVSVVLAWAGSQGVADVGLLEILSRDLGQRGRQWVSEKTIERIRRAQIGNGSGHDSYADILGHCFVTSLAMLGLGLAACFLLTIGRGMVEMAWLLLPPLLGFLGFYLPLLILEYRGSCRLFEIRQQLPYALDLWILAVESGVSFDEAMSFQIRNTPDQSLEQELAQMIRDRRLGKGRNEAFEDLADRVEDDDFKSLILALIVGDSLGTPIADTLRAQADALRLRRTERAERLARTASTKMALPLTLIQIPHVLLIVALVAGGLKGLGGAF